MTTFVPKTGGPPACEPGRYLAMVGPLAVREFDRDFSGKPADPPIERFWISFYAPGWKAIINKSSAMSFDKRTGIVALGRALGVLESWRANNAFNDDMTAYSHITVDVDYQDPIAQTGFMRVVAMYPPTGELTPEQDELCRKVLATGTMPPEPAPGGGAMGGGRATPTASKAVAVPPPAPPLSATVAPTGIPKARKKSASVEVTQNQAYLIRCPCGESFPTEDALAEHFKGAHA